MANEELKQLLKAKNIPQWKAGEILGVSDSTFYRWMRHPLPEEKEKKLREALEKISK